MVLGTVCPWGVGSGESEYNTRYLSILINEHSNRQSPPHSNDFARRGRRQTVRRSSAATHSDGHCGNRRRNPMLELLLLNHRHTTGFLSILLTYLELPPTVTAATVIGILTYIGTLHTVPSFFIESLRCEVCEAKQGEATLSSVLLPHRSVESPINNTSVLLPTQNHDAGDAMRSVTHLPVPHDARYCGSGIRWMVRGAVTRDLIIFDRQVIRLRCTIERS